MLPPGLLRRQAPFYWWETESRGRAARVVLGLPITAVSGFRQQLTDLICVQVVGAICSNPVPHSGYLGIQSPFPKTSQPRVGLCVSQAHGCARCCGQQSGGCRGLHPELGHICGAGGSQPALKSLSSLLASRFLCLEFPLDWGDWGYSCLLQDILDWKTSRTFFYWRLRRLLLEDLVKKKIHNANPELTDGQVQAMLRRWFVEVEGTVKVGGHPQSSLMLCSHLT